MSDKELTVVIPSCDEYVDVVDEFLRFFHMNWNDCPFEVILITQENEYKKDPTISTYTTFKNAKWSDRILKALENTDCKYILHMCEDAFIGGIVNTEYVFRIIEFMKENGIKYYSSPRFKTRRINKARCKGFKNAQRIGKNEPYGINCLAEIWDRNELLRLIQQGIKTAWDIEYNFLIMASQNTKGYYRDYLRDTGNWLNVVHTIYGGDWTYEIKALERKGTPVKMGNRDLMSFSTYVKEKVFHSINIIVPIRFRKPIKQLASKMGIRLRSLD